MNSILSNCTNSQRVPDREKGVVVGIDISKASFTYAACQVGARPSKTCLATQDAAGFEALGSYLAKLAEQGHEVWTAFEPTGAYSLPLQAWLAEQSYRTVQVNSYHVKRSKEMQDNSPLKSDLKDPRVVAALVWQGIHTEIHPMTGTFAELRSASINWSSMTKTRTALANELQGLQAQWFPELSELLKNPVCKSARVLMRKHPSASAIGKSSLARIIKLLGKASRGQIGGAKAEAIWKAGKRSIAVRAGGEQRYWHMLRLIEELDRIESHQNAVCAKMEQLLRQVPQAVNLLSIPQMGPITVSCLLGECGDLTQFKSAQALEKFIGLNLIEVSSGKFVGRHRIGKRGRDRAREVMAQAATRHMKADGLWDKFVSQKREHKEIPGKIQIAVARKLLRLCWTLVHHQQGFTEERFYRWDRGGDDRVIPQGRAQQLAA